MVDLQTQYIHLQTEIDKAIKNVLLSSSFIKGPEVAEFEKKLAEYTGAAFVTGCANGTDALQIALMALDIPKGSEVITPAFGYAALTEVILLMDLVPVFVEVEPDTFLMDPFATEAAITSKTKVLAPVHLYGQTSNMNALLTIAQKHNLYIIEDTAQAIGSKYTLANGDIKQAGTMGHIGPTSFFPSKNLGCYGDGGALFTNNPDFDKKIKMIANHGQSVKYQHDIIGINSRLDTLQAAILLQKLKHLQIFEEKRNQCANYYDKELSGIANLKIPARAENSTHVFHQYTMTLETNELRDNLKKHLAASQIPSMIYYPQPMYKQKAYAANLSMPLTEDLCSRVLSLPIHTEMDDEQLAYISSTVKQFLKA